MDTHLIRIINQFSAFFPNNLWCQMIYKITYHAFLEQNICKLSFMYLINQ